MNPRGWLKVKYRFETPDHYMYFATLELARETRLAQKQEVGDLEIFCSIHGWQLAVFGEGECIECVHDADEWAEFSERLSSVTEETQNDAERRTTTYPVGHNSQ